MSPNDAGFADAGAGTGSGLGHTTGNSPADDGGPVATSGERGDGALGTTSVDAGLESTTGTHSPGTTSSSAETSTTTTGMTTAGDDGNDTGSDDGCGDACECNLGEERPCWTGPTASRMIGICRDGVQQCQETNTGYTWGECEGQLLPADEVSGNEVDEDCDGELAGCVSNVGDACRGNQYCPLACREVCGGCTGGGVQAPPGTSIEDWLCWEENFSHISCAPASTDQFVRCDGSCA